MSEVKSQIDEIHNSSAYKMIIWVLCKEVIVKALNTLCTALTYCKLDLHFGAHVKKVKVLGYPMNRKQWA